MLHYLDDLDSKMESMRAHFEREAESGSVWTSYNSSLGRTLLNTEKFLKHGETAIAAAAATSNSSPGTDSHSKTEPQTETANTVSVGDDAD